MKQIFQHKCFVCRLLTVLLVFFIVICSICGCNNESSTDNSLSSGAVSTGESDLAITSTKGTDTTVVSHSNVSVDTTVTMANTTTKTTEESKKTMTTTSVTTTTTTEPQTQVSAEYIMYVDWNAENEVLQVVQKYSAVEDFVMVLKRIGPNAIFNIAPPKGITDFSEKVSNNVTKAQNKVTMAESDWFGPHIVNATANPVHSHNQFTGGTHGASGVEDDSKGPSGRSDNIHLTVDGKLKKGSLSCYASSLEITWDTYVQAMNTLEEDTEVLVEHHTMTFDGITWKVHTEIEFLQDVKWRCHYGMQCVYGVWADTIRYDNEVTQSIKRGGASTKSGNKKCETITMKKGVDCLEMYLDSSYGIGNRMYVQGADYGAFSQSYGNAVNGKAYFLLVSGKDWDMSKGDKVSYRGHYRFFMDAG